MMILANPIYDTTFKYLLEDLELARALIAKIIGEEIESITPQPNEITQKSKKYEVLILRLDFTAIIKTKNGEYKKVLIELQKAQQLGDIMRFRKYLGHNYAKADSIDGKTETPNGLPIITIYFLGFTLKTIETPVLTVKREYIDLLTNNPLKEREEFIEKLTHDSFIIQIPRLERKVRNELEGILKVFNQSYIASKRTELLIPEEDLPDNELLHKMVDRLRRAVTNTAILEELELEEDFEKILDHAHRKAMISEEKAKLAVEDYEKMKEYAMKAEKNAKKVEENARKEQENAQKRIKEVETKNQQRLNELEEQLRLLQQQHADLLAQKNKKDENDK